VINAGHAEHLSVLSERCQLQLSVFAGLQGKIGEFMQYSIEHYDLLDEEAKYIDHVFKALQTHRLRHLFPTRMQIPAMPRRAQQKVQWPIAVAM
jgi:hypothetical protein